MNPLFVAAAEIQMLCTARGWGFCFIGGLAVLRWGEPRLTRDVDVTILTPYGSEAPVVEELLDRFAGRIDNAHAFALDNRVALLRAANDVPIDVALGALDFEARAVQRATPWNVGETSLVTCSAEDLIVHKAFAARDRDWLDLEGVIARQDDALDVDLVVRELVPLLELKGRPDDLDRLRGLLDLAS